jgi:ligand-binding SRPBCC domain-containing protein
MHPLRLFEAFTERPDVLELLLTPPWQPDSVGASRGGLKVPAVSEFQIFLDPLPLGWVSFTSNMNKTDFSLMNKKKGYLNTGFIAINLLKKVGKFG